MINTVIWDYGGVISVTRRSKLFSAWAEKVFGIEKEKIQVLFDDPICDDYSRGDITTEQFYQRFLKIGIDMDPKAMAVQFASYNKPDPLMDQILKALFELYPMYLISDSTPELTEDVESRMGHYFQEMFFSDKYRTRKDEGLFLTSFLKIPGIYDEWLYIDDREDKLVYPRQQGVTCIHFQSPEQCQQEIEQILQIKI